MQKRFYTHRGFRIGTLIFGLFLIFGIALLATVDLSPLIASRMSAALDKPVSIAEARLKLSFRPRIAMQDVKIGTVNKGRADFADAKSMRVSIDLWEFITGDLVLPEVQLVDARINLTRDAKGNVNWSSEKNTDPRIEPDLPQIESLNIKDTVITYRDEMTKTNLKFNVETQEPLNGKEPALRVRGDGTYQGRDAKLDLRGGSVLKLRDTTAPYPVNGTFSAGKTEVSVAGTVTDPMRMRGLNIKLDVKGENADELFPLFGIAIFPTPSYTLSTKLDRDGGKWILTDMAGKFGETDIAGKLTWNVTGKKPRLEGALHSKSLRLRDMAGFIGAAPGDIETPIEIRTKAADREKERRVQMGQGDVKVANVLLFPDRPMSLEKLNSMDAAVKLTADAVITKAFPVDRLALDLVLDDGVLKLKPLDIYIEDGRLGFDITVNSRVTPIKTDINVAVERVPIRRLVGKLDKTLEQSGTSWGAIGGRIELHGTGESMHKIMATSDGDVALLAEDGRISLLLVELMDLDIAESLGLLLTKDRSIAIRCMAIDMDVKQGLMSTRNFVIDTQDSAIIGSGTADLGREVLDMKLNPKPKDNSIAAIRAPILMTGAFSNPYIGPDPAVVTARGGAALALGLVLSPFAALLPLIEIGTGKDMNCAELIRSTEQTAQTPIKTAPTKGSTQKPASRKN